MTTNEYSAQRNEQQHNDWVWAQRSKASLALFGGLLSGHIPLMVEAVKEIHRPNDRF